MLGSIIDRSIAGNVIESMRTRTSKQKKVLPKVALKPVLDPPRHIIVWEGSSVKASMSATRKPN